MNKFITKFLTTLRGKPDFSKTREVLTPPIREPAAASNPVKTEKFIMESFSCPYCFSKDFQKRGFRQKKLERVQLYLCDVCGKTFSVQNTKGKHYPLEVMLDAISIYNLGYSLEQTCRIVNARLMKETTKKSAEADLVDLTNSSNGWLDNLVRNITKEKSFVKYQNKKGVDSPGVEPDRLGLSSQPSEPAEPAPESLSQKENIGTRGQRDRRSEDKSNPGSGTIQPSTLSNWLSETAELCRFNRMREYALKKYSPKEMVVHATLAHRQLYRFRFHRAKCDLMIREEYQHRKFVPVKEFLEMVPVECPHQYFQEGLRASEAPLTFSKKQMIVRAKQNYATKLAAFVLQSVKERKGRHEALQKFMLANDSVTVATEVPVYITRDDLEHLKTQLGFEIYHKQNPKFQTLNSKQIQKPNNQNSKLKSLENLNLKNSDLFRISDLGFSALPKLITGHIDILQIRNGQIHILDYKPNAEKEKPIEQLTLYAMALSRLTGLRLYEFKCAWFDEKDYFEFYPLHVLHKPKRNQRRRKVYTMEGIYNVNKDDKKILSVRPINV